MMFRRQREMCALASRIDEQHDRLEQCETSEDYVRWLRQYRPDLYMLLPPRVRFGVGYARVGEHE